MAADSTSYPSMMLGDFAGNESSPRFSSPPPGPNLRDYEYGYGGDGPSPSFSSTAPGPGMQPGALPRLGAPPVAPPESSRDSVDSALFAPGQSGHHFEYAAPGPGRGFGQTFGSGLEQGLGALPPPSLGLGLGQGFSTSPSLRLSGGLSSARGLSTDGPSGLSPRGLSTDGLSGLSPRGLGQGLHLGLTASHDTAFSSSLKPTDPLSRLSPRGLGHGFGSAPTASFPGGLSTSDGLSPRMSIDQNFGMSPLSGRLPGDLPGLSPRQHLGQGLGQSLRLPSTVESSWSRPAQNLGLVSPRVGGPGQPVPYAATDLLTSAAPAASLSPGAAWDAEGPGDALSRLSPMAARAGSGLGSRRTVDHVGRSAASTSPASRSPRGLQPLMPLSPERKGNILPRGAVEVEEAPVAPTNMHAGVVGNTFLILPAAALQVLGLMPNMNDKDDDESGRGEKTIWFGRVWQIRQLLLQRYRKKVLDRWRPLSWEQQKHINDVMADPRCRMLLERAAKVWRGAAERRAATVAGIFGALELQLAAYSGTVLLVHGSSGLSDIEMRYARCMATMGYIVISPDCMAGAVDRRRVLAGPIKCIDPTPYWGDSGYIDSTTTTGRSAYSSLAQAVCRDPTEWKQKCERIFQMRNAEMHWILSRLPTQMKIRGVFTMGDAEGAMSVARFDDHRYGSMIRGRIISAFGAEYCHYTPTREAAGFGGSPKVATLNIIGEKDDYFGPAGSVASRVAYMKDRGGWGADRLAGHAFKAMGDQQVERGLVCVLQEGGRDCSDTHDNFLRDVLRSFLASPNDCHAVAEQWRFCPYLSSIVTVMEAHNKDGCGRVLCYVGNAEDSRLPYGRELLRRSKFRPKVKQNRSATSFRPRSNIGIAGRTVSPSASRQATLQVRPVQPNSWARSGSPQQSSSFLRVPAPDRGRTPSSPNRGRIPSPIAYPAQARLGSTLPVAPRGGRSVSPVGSPARTRIDASSYGARSWSPGAGPSQFVASPSRSGTSPLRSGTSPSRSGNATQQMQVSGQYSIRLLKNKGSFGFSIKDTNVRIPVLTVEWMDPQGALATWNARRPAMALNLGDDIVAVNGLSGDAEAMCEALASNFQVDLVCRRSHRYRPVEGQHV